MNEFTYLYIPENFIYYLYEIHLYINNHTLASSFIRESNKIYLYMYNYKYFFLSLIHIKYKVDDKIGDYILKNELNNNKS